MKPCRAPDEHAKRSTGLGALAGLAALCSLLLSGCALPDKAVRPSVFDFGAGHVSVAGAPPTNLAPVALATVAAPASLDSSALLYRLGYADAQQPRPYANARWSMPPAQLLQQRLRERLAAQRAVLNADHATALRAGGAPQPWLLRVELEEFSQWFDTPQQSLGQLRLRATVTQDTPTGSRLLSQRSFAVQRPAPQPDAVGAVRALTAASDAAIDELLLWLAALQ
jgi:cholesterol transport system auxiliary component